MSNRKPTDRELYEEVQILMSSLIGTNITGKKRPRTRESTDENREDDENGDDSEEMLTPRRRRRRRVTMTTPRDEVINLNPDNQRYHEMLSSQESGRENDGEGDGEMINSLNVSVDEQSATGSEQNPLPVVLVDGDGDTNEVVSDPEPIDDDQEAALEEAERIQNTPIMTTAVALIDQDIAQTSPTVEMSSALVRRVAGDADREGVETDLFGVRTFRSAMEFVRKHAKWIRRIGGALSSVLTRAVFPAFLMKWTGAYCPYATMAAFIVLGWEKPLKTMMSVFTPISWNPVKMLPLFFLSLTKEDPTMAIALARDTPFLIHVMKDASILKDLLRDAIDTDTQFMYRSLARLGHYAMPIYTFLLVEWAAICVSKDLDKPLDKTFLHKLVADSKSDHGYPSVVIPAFPYLIPEMRRLIGGFQVAMMNNSNPFELNQRYSELIAELERITNTVPVTGDTADNT